jgi:hypothetical protein
MIQIPVDHKNTSMQTFYNNVNVDLNFFSMCLSVRCLKSIVLFVLTRHTTD